MPGLVRYVRDGLDQEGLELLQRVHLTMPTSTAVATTKTQ